MPGMGAGYDTVLITETTRAYDPAVRSTLADEHARLRGAPCREFNQRGACGGYFLGARLSVSL